MTMIDSGKAITVGSVAVLDAGDGSGPFAATVTGLSFGYNHAVGADVTTVTVKDTEGYTCQMTLDELRAAQLRAETAQYQAHITGTDARRH